MFTIKLVNMKTFARVLWIIALTSAIFKIYLKYDESAKFREYSELNSVLMFVVFGLALFIYVVSLNKKNERP